MAAPSMHLVERVAQRWREKGDAGRLGVLLGTAMPAVQVVVLRSDDVRNGAMHPRSAPLTAEAMEHAGWTGSKDKRDRLYEEFSIVQGQILRVMSAGTAGEPDGLNLVMITSSKPDEGKSFFALNLAASIAGTTGRQALLVDVDGRHSSLTHLVGLAKHPGLLDLALDASITPDDLLVPTALSKMNILPIGARGRPELSSPQQISEIVQRLGRHFAQWVVILDAPPCLSSSDPSALAEVVGQIVFVIEAQQTQRDEVEASLELVQSCPRIGLVLNKAQLSSKSTFGEYS